MDGMDRVFSRKCQSGTWVLWVEGLGDMRSGHVDLDALLIGCKHDNGDGLHLSIGIESSSLTIRSDVISGIPVFILKGEQGAVIASSLALLMRATRRIGVQPELDLGACSEVMLSSYVFTRERALLKGVTRLLPNHELTVDLHGGEVSSKRVAEDFSYAKQPESWQWCVQRLRENLVSGMMRHASKRVAVMLSGGADSRITAASAVEAGLQPDFITFGQSTVNASDFAVASAVAYRLGRPIRAFSATAEQFKRGWKDIARKSNWTDMWNLAKLPTEFFERISQYDVVLRGDGDGIYGWKGIAGNVSDVLHLLEISPMAAALKCAQWFQSPEGVFAEGEKSRRRIIEEHGDYAGSLTDLENVLYQRHREYGSIAQNIWLLDNWMIADAPLLWSDCIRVAARIPRGRRSRKQVVFAVMDTFERVRGVPFSSGGSWNDSLENWYSGVNEELIDYVAKWSPWPVDRRMLQASHAAPPEIPAEHRCRPKPAALLRSLLQRQPWVRRYVLQNQPGRVLSSFCLRGLTRLAVLSNLREVVESGEVEKQSRVAF